MKITYEYNHSGSKKLTQPFHLDHHNCQQKTTIAETNRLAGKNISVYWYAATMTDYEYPQHALRNVNNETACKKTIYEVSAIVQHDSYISLVISIRGVISAQ